MKFKVLLFISAVAVAFMYCKPVFSSWVTLPQDDGQCPRNFELIAVDTDYGELDVCVPEEVSPAQEPPPAGGPPPANSPRNGVPLEGPHFEGAI